MRKLYILVLLLFNISIQAQAVVIAQQDFESSPASPVLGYSNVGGGVFSGSSGTGSLPASSPYFVSSNTGFNLNNGTGTLTFPSTSTSIDVSAYSNISVSFRVASFSINATNGADGGDYVRIDISPNNGTNWYSQIQLNGNNNATWSYTAGTGVASRNYSTGAVTPIAPGGGGARTTDGYSTITVNNLPSTSQLRIRITLFNDNANERWLIDNVIVSGDASTPTINASPNITGLNYFLGAGPSAAQSFNISGTKLDPEDDTIYVYAPANFKIATASGGTYVDTLKFPYTDSVIATTAVWTRLIAGLSTGSYADSIVITGGTAPTKKIGVSGSVIEPTITPSTTSVTGLNYVVGLGASKPQLFTVSASNLTTTTGNLTVTAPANFLICATETGAYVTSFNIPFTGSALASANVFVVLQSGLSFNSYADSITISGGGAASKKVGVSGTVSAHDCNELFISEYVVGTSNNKFIEIYNPTANTINLCTGTVNYYRLQVFTGGSMTATNIGFTSGSSIAPYSTYIIRNGSSTIYSGTSQTSGSINFTGDDAVSLQKYVTPATSLTATSVSVDIIGRIGEDPGTAWTSGVISTAGQTLVRNPTVRNGVTTNPASGFPTLGTEWIAYPIDESHFLGSHVSTCQNPNYTIASISSISPTTYCPGDAISIPFEAFGTYTGNTFTAQLSNSAGSFALPTPLGSIVLSGTNPTGTINATIPTGATAGTQYHVRVISSSPAGAYLPNGQELTILTTTPNNVSNEAAGTGTNSSTISWDVPTGCWQEIMVVLTTTSELTFAPSGTGSGYTANSVYSGSGNQVVYKGTGTSVNVTNLVLGNIYHFEIYVRNGTSWSSGVEVSRLVDTYCHPKYNYYPIAPSIGSCDEYISNVTLESINNSTTEGCGLNGYNWYANQSTTLTKGETYVLNVRVGIYGATNDESYRGDDIRVYIDYNKDGDFDDLGERIVNLVDNGGTGSYTFTVPSGIAAGSYRLRVQLLYYSGSGSPSDPNLACDQTFRDGETEDYTLNIIDPCIPVTTAFNYYPNNGTAGTEVKISAPGAGNFSSVTNVLFNNIPATSFTIVDEKTIYAIVPDGAGTGRITLVDNSPCKRVSTANFTYELNTGTCNNYNELFISEIYDPGSGNNHYVEIFNGTENAINLDVPNNYTIRVVNKSSLTDANPTINTINITGVINPGQTRVYYAGANGGLATGTQASAGSGFNAYDEIQLMRNGVLIDVVQGPTPAGYNYRRYNSVAAPSTTYTATDWNRITSGLSTSDIGLFTPLLPLKITAQPSDVNSCSINMSVTATGSGTITYQWYYNNNRANETGWTALTDGSTNFAAINHGIVNVSGANLDTLRITGELTYINNHQFYCVVSNGTCFEYSNAAQFKLNPDRFFKSKQNGTWTSAANWQMAPSVTGPWNDACTYPTYSNSDYVHIMSGDTITIWENTSTTPDVIIDQLVIESGGQLVLDYLAELHLANASGIDMIVEGSFYHKGTASPNGITFLDNVTSGDSATWILNNFGEIIKSATGSLVTLKERYDGGIVNIPATAHWRFRKDTTFSYAIAYSVNDFTYPNLYFENTTPNPFIFPLPAASFTSYATVKGNLSVGYNSTSTVDVQNNNYNATPFTVLKNVSIENGSTFRLSGTSPNTGTGLAVYGNVLVDGTLDLNLASKGLLEFKGDANQTYSGSGTIDLYDVTLNKDFQKLVTLNRDLIVNNFLTFGTGGIINANGNEVSIINNTVNAVSGFDTPNNTGIYSNDKYVHGKLRRKVTGSNTYVFPVGDSVSGEAYNPSRLVLRAVPTGPEAVCEFIPSWPGALNTFRTFYCGGQLKFLDYQGLTGEGYWKYGGSSFTNYDVYIHPNLKNLNVLPNDDISRPPGALNYNNTYRALKEVDSKAGAVWDPNVSTAGDPCIVSPSYYEIIGAGYSGFSIFAPGGGLGNSTPLPIELLEFKAICEQNTVNLYWSTASEKNVDYFTIEKSFDGINFYKVGNVIGAGNSSTLKNYQLNDPDYNGALTYYRLVETDFDGNIYYHGIRTVECDNENGFLNVFYSEGEGIVANLYTGKFKKFEFTVYDAAGRLILNNIQSLSEGSYRIPVSDTKILAKGIYFVSVFDGKEIKTVKVLVK